MDFLVKKLLVSKAFLSIWLFCF